MNKMTTTKATTHRSMPHSIETVNALYGKAKSTHDKAEQLWITLGLELKEAKVSNMALCEYSRAVRL